MVGKNHVIVIDNGHGGIKGGKYVTAPDKMFVHPNGHVVYEGLFNRQVAEKLMYLMKNEQIPFELLVPEVDDISLTERGKRINALHKKHDGKIVLVSLHGNAGKGTGFEVFTSKGQTDSDLIAGVFVEEMAKEFPAKKMRVDVTDGDLDKEANFSILMNKGLAVLCEAFFMDRLEEAQLMTSNRGQAKIAEAYFNAIKRIYKIGVSKKGNK